VEDGSSTDEVSGVADGLSEGATSTDTSAETAGAGAFTTGWATRSAEGAPANKSVWAPFMNPISWLSAHQPPIEYVSIQ
jgi:hypothetical protein